MTNVGTVVLIGIIYALDVCYIALTCSPMTPLELQPLLVYHNDRTWLSWTVPRCIYDMLPVLYVHHSKVGHDGRGQSWTVRMSVVVRYN